MRNLYFYKKNKNIFALTTLFSVFVFSNVVYGSDNELYQSQREKMVIQQLQKRGISDQRVLKAMGKVPRHRFVPHALKDRSYGDHPLAIGEGQTISQPYIVALMTESLQLSEGDRVLEIGTGSGYQAAVLAEIVDEVYSVEIREKLYQQASMVLRNTGCHNVNTRLGDGYFGWKEVSPFDAVMITASVDHIPPPLLSQLKDGGKLILPLGNPFSYQNLTLVTRKGEDYSVKQITGVLFVPMTGRALQ
ncbi:MAG: protein-L-isoaspartate(D-aspartate) O-methyltransferase [Desulfobacterales bacterium]